MKQSKKVFLFASVMLLMLTGCSDKSKLLAKTWMVSNLKYTKEIPKELRPAIDNSVNDMKKSFVVVRVIESVMFLANCHSERKEKLAGIWKLDVMDINNTPISGSSLGSWLWEFNDEGGYLINIAGAVEKGTYKVDKEKLTLSSVTNKDRPDQIYTIVKLDSVLLNLTSATEKNKTTLSFIKVKGEEVVEKD